MNVIDNSNILYELEKINDSLDDITINISSEKINSIDLSKEKNKENF